MLGGMSETERRTRHGPAAQHGGRAAFGRRDRGGRLPLTGDGVCRSHGRRAARPCSCQVEPRGRERAGWSRGRTLDRRRDHAAGLPRAGSRPRHGRAAADGRLGLARRPSRPARRATRSSGSWPSGYGVWCLVQARRQVTRNLLRIDRSGIRSARRAATTRPGTASSLVGWARRPAWAGLADAARAEPVHLRRPRLRRPRGHPTQPALLRPGRPSLDRRRAQPRAALDHRRDRGERARGLDVQRPPRCSRTGGG